MKLSFSIHKLYCNCNLHSVELYIVRLFVLYLSICGVCDKLNKLISRLWRPLRHVALPDN